MINKQINIENISGTDTKTTVKSKRQTIYQKSIQKKNNCHFVSILKMNS